MDDNIGVVIGGILFVASLIGALITAAVHAIGFLIVAAVLFLVGVGVNLLVWSFAQEQIEDWLEATRSAAWILILTLISVPIVSGIWIFISVLRGGASPVWLLIYLVSMSGYFYAWISPRMAERRGIPGLVITTTLIETYYEMTTRAISEYPEQYFRFEEFVKGRKDASKNLLDAEGENNS